MAKDEIETTGAENYLSILGRSKTVISDGVTTVFSTRTFSTNLDVPVVTTNSRVFTEQEEPEEKEDEGFAGVAVITELPRFNLESSPRLSPPRIKQPDEEEEDIVSSEAFRNGSIF